MDDSNELEEDFLTINLSEDNIERINKFYLKRLEILCGLMAVENKLCDPCGEGIVAEFGFKGNRAEVLAQLSEELRFRQTTPYTLEDKPKLIQRSIQFGEYLRIKDSNPIKKKIKQLFLDNWLSGRDVSAEEIMIEELQAQYHKNRDDMHNRRECLCFNNS